jgi:hypothetical protein
MDVRSEPSIMDAVGFRYLIETNLTGYFLVTKAFIPFFLYQKKVK